MMVSNYTVCQTSFLFTYFIASNCAKLHNFFFFMMDYGENGYLYSKIGGGGGGGGGWNKDVLGGKKWKN